MNEKEVENFRSSNSCWICKKLIDDEKVRDHCHITEKCRVAAHWICNVNSKMTKKVFFNISLSKKIWQSFNHECN